MLDMLGRSEAVSVKRALDLLERTHFETAVVEKIKIEKAYQRVLSEDITSPENLPQFSRSTMDGYAVIASDTFGASESLPAYLKVKDEVVMGQKPAWLIHKGEVASIPTGGMLPNGTDAVVMFEHVHRIDSTLIEVMKAVAPGENVIQVGEDSGKGDMVLKKGHLLRAQDVGVLAGLGITKVMLFRKPVVSVISTGDEIVQPDKPLEFGKIRDTNSYHLTGLIENAGGEPIRKGIFRDNYEDIKEILEESLKDSQMILITGGSSVGTRDMTATIINDFGKRGVIFHGVTIKPGKPIVAGVIDGKPVFGLPGHPVAVAVSFEMFVKKVLRRISGQNENLLVKFSNTVHARLTKNISSAPGREDHIRVKIMERDSDLWAEPILGKSGLISTLVHADGTIVIPDDKRGVLEGEKVLVRLLL